jgi:hypothetical protein
MEFIKTGFVIELNGKFLRTDWSRFAWHETIEHATIFNDTMKETTDIVASWNAEYENIKNAKLVPVKRITTYQLEEF